VSRGGGLRRIVFGLATVLGLARRGFFIPYRYAGQMPAGGPDTPYAAIEALFREREPAFLAVLDDMDGLADALRAIGVDAAPPEPRWRQDWFPRLDAAVAYRMVRRLAPARIVEVGSGHSTRFLARAVADGGLPTRIEAIDPAPRADLASLGARVSLRRRTVQEAGEAAFADLAAGDLLLIDSSHILMPGTDVDFLFNRVLPALPAGVLVHVHDVFLPDPYPAGWGWRGYNEQLGLGPLLLGGGFELLFASRYVVTRLARALARSPVEGLPLLPGAFESSVWLRRR